MIPPPGADLCEQLAAGATLLTANRRLFRYMRERFDAHQAQSGLEVWPSADILSLPAWLGRCWELGLQRIDPDSTLPGAGARLLSDAQETVLWEQIVAADAQARNLLQPASAARLARRAQRLLTEWRLQLPAPPSGGWSEETRAFLRWRKSFAAECAAKGWVSATALPDIVAQWLAAGLVTAPPRLLLAGFDEFTPQQEALLDALRSNGSRVELLPFPQFDTTSQRTPCLDANAEIEAAARWARHYLEAGGSGTIGIIVPELGALRGNVERIFREVLAPGAVLAGSNRAQPFNISLGRPLADYPLVDAALAFLAMGRQPLLLTEVSRLLLSPFLAGAQEEAGPRAMLDAQLRRGGELETSLSRIMAEAARPLLQGHASPHHAPQLASSLAAWREAFTHLRGGRKSPVAWAAVFSDLLRTLGWPERLRLNSGEHQTWEKLLELFSTFAALEPVLPSLTWQQALSRLRRLAAETEFQPEGEPARVQILGELEATGMDFERVWILGLHEEAWPRPARPNPFLPSAWQRAHELPQSSSAREAAYARRITARLLASAPEAVVSHPLRDGERSLRPSPLIAALPTVPLHELPQSTVPAYRQIIQRSARLEVLTDHQAPPLAPGHQAGGAGIFEDQSACPFRAFARHRLGASALESPTPGLDASARGRLMHRALERIWARLESQANLNRLTPQEQQALVEEVIAEVLAEAERRYPATMRGKFKEIETQRLIRLLAEHLENERARAPFTVTAREQETLIKIAGLEVNTRIDRIDQLEDSRHVVLDYKSGKSSWRDWQGPRPDAPQLPLYCTSGGLDIAAVAFAQVRRGESRFHGLEVETGILPQATRFDQIPPPPDVPTPPDRDSVLAAWRTVLERLATDYLRGEATVDPKDPRKTCQYCDLPALCRIYESGSQFGGGEESDDG
ncbi:MAG: PD-(D/E)XK nuclease family protein [SAR324 cluster bacterium]|nr:PD-(D/E)XK nuclease family protein [SAR324 cluster bacterium]